VRHPNNTFISSTYLDKVELFYCIIFLSYWWAGFKNSAEFWICSLDWFLLNSSRNPQNLPPQFRFGHVQILVAIDFLSSILGCQSCVVSKVSNIGMWSKIGPWKSWKSVQIRISNLRTMKTDRNGNRFIGTEIDKPVPHIPLLNILSDEVLAHAIRCLSGYIY
jgi:hypothetical protein